MLSQWTLVGKNSADRSDAKETNGGWIVAWWCVALYTVVGLLVGFGAGFGTGWASHAGTADSDAQEYDFSGHGICQGSTITVIHGALWTQYPDVPRVLTPSPVYIPHDYVGKNAIVWADDYNILDFKITAINNADRTVTSAVPLHVQGKCHFTLDMIGTVKFFNANKGYGFITNDESGEDVFVHNTALNGVTLKEGDKVEYTNEEGNKGEQASNIIIM